MRFVVRSVLSCLLLATAAPVAAQTRVVVPPAAAVPRTPQRQPAASIVAEPAALLIAACDADGDARVTRDELTRCIARSFTGEPAKGGAIGYIGYSDWALKWLGDRNALPSPFTVDADADDRITLVELQARFQALFDRFDIDRDGVLTRAELLTIRAGTGGGEPGGRRGRRGGKPDQLAP